MRRKKTTVKVKEDLSANVIPMVDIMFLLVLFFMLAADMTQKDLAVMELPAAQNIVNEKEEKETNINDKRPTVNIVHDSAYDQSCPTMVQRHNNPNIKAENELICRAEGHWVYDLKKEIYPDTKEGIKKLEDKLREFRVEYDEINGRKNDPATATKPSEMRVMVRADRAAPFGYVQRVMAVCGKVFVFKVQVGAAELKPIPGA